MAAFRYLLRKSRCAKPAVGVPLLGAGLVRGSPAGTTFGVELKRDDVLAEDLRYRPARRSLETARKE
ncbi:hypothetical protein IscW_ISCW015522 [Ixodes scapularis]|uniref:Uncharacterized protein n=1 Tax=Ixodes scapularis TaxID=6945 RepID=B7QNB4_IXOSC|nr:hypothetical protein IscW_ISCW015522 [Ixodes scapularis]|eukprot:XP_002416419.1 hypothetical protein IscW_ISCW015522 [Ixodes scapularis]